MTPELDIVIPVYNEGRNIVAVLAALKREVTTPARVLICYDHAEDDTLPAIRANPQAHAGLPLEFVRNHTGRGVHGAVTTGFAASTAPFILMFPADDHVNAPMLDRMVALARGGCDIVCASRFMPGGAMIGCPWLKAALVRSANFTLRHVARLPTTDASNGFRMFSRRVIGAGTATPSPPRSCGGRRARSRSRSQPLPFIPAEAGIQNGLLTIRDL